MFNQPIKHMTTQEPQAYLPLTAGLAVEICINAAGEEVRWRYTGDSDYKASTILYDSEGVPYFKANRTRFYIHEFEII